MAEKLAVLRLYFAKTIDFTEPITSMSLDYVRS